MSDESGLARQAARPIARGRAVFRSEMAQVYGTLPSADELAELGDIAVAVTASGRWAEPDWEHLGEEVEGPGASKGFFQDGGGCYGPGCGGLAVLALLVLGGVELADAIDDNTVRRTWSPCLDRLQRAAGDWGLQRRLYGHLAESAAGSTSLFVVDDEDQTPGSDGYGGLLRVNLQRAEIGNCQAELAVCTEIAVRGTLIDRRTSALTYDRTYVFTNPLRVPAGGYEDAPPGYGLRPAHGIWEYPVRERAECVSLAEFCGSGGADRFTRQLDLGLQHIVAAIGRDLGFVAAR